MTQKRENALLDRTEVFFTISHPAAGTPTRSDIRKAVAGTVDAKDRIVILDWARSDFGRTTTRGYAKVYKSKEHAMSIETFPILVRNGLAGPLRKASADKILEVARTLYLRAREQPRTADSQQNSRPRDAEDG